LRKYKEIMKDMAENNKKYLELLWYQKNNKLGPGEKEPIEKPNLLLKIVEIMNKPRLKNFGDALFAFEKFYPENKYLEGYSKGWKVLLILRDSKFVMSFLTNRAGLKRNITNKCQNEQRSGL
jgi:hypothetical protein